MKIEDQKSLACILLSQPLIDTERLRRRVYRNFADKLTPIQISTCDTRNEKIGHGFVRGQRHLIGRAIPYCLDNC